MKTHSAPTGLPGIEWVTYPQGKAEIGWAVGYLGGQHPVIWVYKDGYITHGRTQVVEDLANFKSDAGLSWPEDKEKILAWAEMLWRLA